MSILKLSLRNTLRHRTRSLIAIAAITFGVVAVVLTGGFIEWIFWAIREAAIQTGLGHVHVVRPGYKTGGAADPFNYLLVDSGERERIEKSPGVVAVAPRLNFAGLISRGDSTISFVGEGVDSLREKSVSRVLNVSRGSELSADEPKGVLLGAGLAAKLAVAPGDEVVLLATSASGSINAVDATVRGFFVSELKAYDDSAVRVPIALARDLLKTPGSHVWVLALEETERTAATIETLRRQFKATDFEFIPWYDLADFYQKSVRLLSSQVTVVQAIIGLIIVLSISNVLIMSVLERTGEIGTLMAMGSTKRNILTQFLWEGFFLGLIGSLLGVVLGTVLALTISAIGIPMPPPPGRQQGYSGEVMLTAPLLFTAFTLALSTTVIASLYPAWKGSRMVIVDALRHNR